MHIYLLDFIRLDKDELDHELVNYHKWPINDRAYHPQGLNKLPVLG